MQELSAESAGAIARSAMTRGSVKSPHPLLANSQARRLFLVFYCIIGLLLTACATPPITPTPHASQSNKSTGSVATDPATQSTEHTLAWQPFQMKGDSYYHYQLFDASNQQQGNFNLTISHKSAKKLTAHWQVRFDNQQLFMTDTDNTDGNIMRTSYSVLMTSGQARIIADTLLNPWWWSFQTVGLQQNHIIHLPHSQATITTRIKQECRINRHKGLVVELYDEHRILARACITADVPLPLKVTTYDHHGSTIHTAELSIYRSHY